MIFASAATVDSEGWLWIGWFSPAAMEIPENQREPTYVCNHDWFSGTRTYLTWQQMICNWKLHHGHVHLKVLNDIRPPSRLTWMPRVSICSRQRRGCPSLKTGDVVLTINENKSFQLRWCDPNLGFNVRRNPPLQAALEQVKESERQGVSQLEAKVWKWQSGPPPRGAWFWLKLYRFLCKTIYESSTKLYVAFFCLELSICPDWNHT
jgi:hypothetical protein